MSRFFSLVQLPGSASVCSEKPQCCKACGFTKMFVQSDFNRSIGVWLVGFATVLTVYFAYEGYNWWLTWAPFLVFLLVDRFLYYVMPLVVICYKCEHLHRGLPKEIAQKFPGFDLDEHDRVHYADHSQNSSNR